MEDDQEYTPTVPYEIVRDELLADPEVRTAYDALEPAFQIANARIGAGLTQAQLARLLGVHRSTIAHMERGQRQPTIPFLLKLAKALGRRLVIDFMPEDQQRP